MLTRELNSLKRNLVAHDVYLTMMQLHKCKQCGQNYLGAVEFRDYLLCLTTVLLLLGKITSLCVMWSILHKKFPQKYNKISPLALYLSPLAAVVHWLWCSHDVTYWSCPLLDLDGQGISWSFILFSTSRSGTDGSTTLMKIVCWRPQADFPGILPVRLRSSRPCFLILCLTKEWF